MSAVRQIHNVGIRALEPSDLSDAGKSPKVTQKKPAPKLKIGRNDAELKRFNPQPKKVPRTPSYYIVYRIAPGFKSVSVSYEAGTFRENFANNVA